MTTNDYEVIQDEQRLRFVKIVTWLLRLYVLFTLLTVIILIVATVRMDSELSEEATPISVILVVLSTAVIYYAYRKLHEGRTELAANIISGVFLLTAMISIFTNGEQGQEMQDTGLEMLILLPILTVGIALPFQSRANLRRLTYAAWFVTVFVVAVGEYQRLRAIGSPSGDLITQRVFGGIFVIGFVALILYLLAQFRHNMSSMLEYQQQHSGRLETVGGELETRVAELVELRTQLQQRVEQERASNQELQALRQELEAHIERLQEQERQQIQQRKALESKVDEYLRFTQSVARGNLTERLSIGGSEALDQLGLGLNTMVGSLQRLSQQIQEAAQNIITSAVAVQSATTQQAASVAEQSASITQTTTTIEEVKAIAQQTARQASDVARTSSHALQIAQQGTEAVARTVDGMGQIKARVQTIAETILALSEQTQAIGSIIQTVNELADQSNLLALNAAIEAARAGEQGKSFAVVAQHVRELAERSKAATGQVREILGEIQQATNAAVMVTEEGSKGVEAGARLAGEAGQVIQRIAGEVESGAQANMQMAAAAQQQTTGMEQIGLAMHSIQAATLQTLSNTRQAETAARDLKSLAESLQEAIAAYRT